MNSRRTSNGSEQFARAIIFQEGLTEKVYDASNDEALSKSCLLVLKERFNEPKWGYKPVMQNLTKDEQEFLEFMNDEYEYLPTLLKKMSDRIYRSLETKIDTSLDPDWSWYKKVKEFLEIPEEKAIDYRVPSKGRYIPTSYHLLSQRRTFPREGFIIVDN